MTYELHPLCTLFPRLNGAEFDALRDDIKANGLRTPIVLHGGMILDGGNRYRACVEAGVQPVFTEFDGGSLVAFVLSANLHRRHMSAGQQAAIVASAQDWAKAQTVGSNQHKAKAQGPATLPDQPLATVADRAAQSGASERTQRMADKVAKADPALAVKVAHGEVTLPRALEQVEGKKIKPAPAPAAVADDAFDGFDPIAELESTQKLLEAAEKRIESLTADDIAAELNKQVGIRQGIEARLSLEMKKVGELQKELDSYGKWYAELRKASGLEKRSEITKLVREAANNRSEAV